MELGPHRPPLDPKKVLRFIAHTIADYGDLFIKGEDFHEYGDLYTYIEQSTWTLEIESCSICGNKINTRISPRVEELQRSKPEYVDQNRKPICFECLPKEDWDY